MDSMGIELSPGIPSIEPFLTHLPAQRVSMYTPSASFHKIGIEISGRATWSMRNGGELLKDNETRQKALKCLVSCSIEKARLNRCLWDTCSGRTHTMCPATACVSPLRSYEMKDPLNGSFISYDLNGSHMSRTEVTITRSLYIYNFISWEVNGTPLDRKYVQ